MLDYTRFAPTGDNKTIKYARNDTKREKRLERNRESARKCRRKRKAYVGDLEDKCNAMAEDNAMLQLENDRLRELLQQLQNGTGTLPDELPAKRAKSEFGVSMANDLSESAVHANQQSRLENFSQLAILTTFLLLTTLTATTLNLVPCQTTQSSAAPAPVARPTVNTCELQEKELWLRQRSCSVT